VGGSNRGGIKAPSKPFPSFSKSGVFGSKLFQTKLWRFCGISRGYKASKRPLMLSKFFASGRPVRPHFGRRGTAFHASRRMASSASGSSLVLRCSSVEAFIEGSDPDRQNFEPYRQSDFWEDNIRNSPPGHISARDHTSGRGCPARGHGCPAHVTVQSRDICRESKGGRVSCCLSRVKSLRCIRFVWTSLLVSSRV
jgi:hypothetical protein